MAPIGPAAGESKDAGDPAPAPTNPTEATSTPDRPAGAKRDAELAAKVTGYVDAFMNTEPVFTRGGKALLFVSTRDGLPQLYTATTTGPARRVLATQQRVSDLVAAPGGRDVLFASDTGADEQWSYFRVGIDGNNLVELTPNDKLSRGRMFVPNGRPSLVFFSARKMKEAKSTVYSISSTAPSTPKAIYTDDKPAMLVDVAATGTVGLVRRMLSYNEQYVMRLDLDSGATKQVFPVSGKVAIHDAVISHDGARAYVATDNGEEQTVVVAIDLATGKQLAKRAFTATASITKLAFAKETRLLAVTLAVGNHSEIHVIDARTLADRTSFKLPAGTGVAAAFSDDGKQLVVNWSTPDSPHDLYVVDTSSGKIEARREPRPSLGAIDLEIVDTQIPAFDGGRIPIHAYVPKGERAKPHPTIVVYHGGPADVSTLRWRPWNAFFVALGYTVVEPNVRGSNGYGRTFLAADDGPKRLDAFRDIESSARWVATQPWADKDRMVVFGGSYGGYTTLVALTRWPELWRAGVDLFGVANLETFMATTSGLIREIFLVEFGDPEKDAAFLKSISPLTDVGKIVDPLFVYAGANDPRVPRSESDLIVRATRGRKIPTEYMVAANEGHSISRRENQIELFSRIARFLETQLK